MYMTRAKPLHSIGSILCAWKISDLPQGLPFAYLSFTMLLRIILGEDNIKKVHLDKLPDTIEDFCDFLKTELGLSGEIIIQHQDPDFNMELYNLNSMLDLPRDKATLKLEYEFARLTAVNLRETLITGIDKYLDRFLELFRAKRAIPGLSSLIRQLDHGVKY
uniref:Uncharacterized protein n=1 Tax=Knipowitschia caucasica TaxID=637954 RepID=A0AAV2J2R2_KNICA